MTEKITIAVASDKPGYYTAQVGAGLLSRSKRWLFKQYNKIVIITDNRVKKYYGLALASHLQKSGQQVLLLSVPAGERSKTYPPYLALTQQMLRAGCGRDSLIVALGGGVVGDLAGFIAATYMRGIPYIQIPTTLLAMVDSSVGGKTGIDTPQGKNQLGAFWHPAAVVADIDCLKSLPQRHWINGLLETVKIFLAQDSLKFQVLDEKLESILANKRAAVQRVIVDSLQAKATVVTADPREQGLRMVLNVGHTIGHALEWLSDYKLLHGYAVGYGILIEAKISQLLGFLDLENYQKIATFLHRLGIEGKRLKKFNSTQMIEATRADKKAQRSQVRYVLLRDIGKVVREGESFAQRVPDKIVQLAFRACVEG